MREDNEIVNLLNGNCGIYVVVAQRRGGVGVEIGMIGASRQVRIGSVEVFGLIHRTGGS